MSDLSFGSFGSFGSCSGADCDCDCDCDCPDCNCDCDSPDCDCECPDCDCDVFTTCYDVVSECCSCVRQSVREGFENYVCCCLFQTTTTDGRRGSHDSDEEYHHSQTHNRAHNFTPGIAVIETQPYTSQPHKGGKAQARKDKTNKEKKKEGDENVSPEELERMVMENDDSWQPPAENVDAMPEEPSPTLKNEDVNVVMSAENERSVTLQTDSVASQYHVGGSYQAESHNPEPSVKPTAPEEEDDGKEEMAAKTNVASREQEKVNLEPLTMPDDEQQYLPAGDMALSESEQNNTENANNPEDQCGTESEIPYPQVAPPDYQDVVTDQPADTSNKVV